MKNIIKYNNNSCVQLFLLKKEVDPQVLDLCELSTEAIEGVLTDYSHDKVSRDVALKVHF